MSAGSHLLIANTFANHEFLCFTQLAFFGMKKQNTCLFRIFLQTFLCKLPKKALFLLERNVWRQSYRCTTNWSSLVARGIQ